MINKKNYLLLIIISITIQYNLKDKIFQDIKRFDFEKAKFKLRNENNKLDK